MSAGAIGRCLWTEAAPPPRRPTVPLPGRADVAVVGGGYTGLAAARALARRGTDVVLLERQTLGSGASSRNGGFVLPGYQPEMDQIARRFGGEEARRLFRLSLDAVRHLQGLIAEERIDCDLVAAGGVTLAAKPGHMAALERSARFLRRELGYETPVLDRRELGEEIGSARYHGGVLDPGALSLQPARFLQGLATAAERAGAALLEGVEVVRLRRREGVFELTTSCGSLRAREVFVATNGHTGAAFPALRRRVVPVGSHLIATAPLDPEQAHRLIPKGRVLSDTKRLLYYFRLSPDGRMVFGGRASLDPAATRRSARMLAAEMGEVFPELADAPVQYAWSGTVAFTLDRLPHAGRLEGMHYALGYCGHGVALSTYLGARMGEALAAGGALPALTAADFPAVPLYGGWPWFLPATGAYYRARDWLS